MNMPAQSVTVHSCAEFIDPPINCEHGQSEFESTSLANETRLKFAADVREVGELEKAHGRERFPS